MKFEEIDKWLDDRYGLSYTDLKKINNWLCDVRERHNKELERLNNIIDKAREYIENEDVDVTTIRYNDIFDIKNELLDILKEK